MAKSNKKKRGVSLTQSKYLRTGALALVGLVVAGGAFAATSGDLAYSARSLVAQVISGIDTTPRLTIVRNAYTPSGSIWPGAGKTLAIFDVNPKYLSGYGYLRAFTGSVHTDSKTAGLNVGNISVQWESCAPTCYTTKIPLSMTASSTSKGLAYFFSTTDSNPLPIVGPYKTGKIIITGHPYYGSIYNNPAVPLPAASVKAQIDAGKGAGETCTTVGGVKSCRYDGVAVYTSLAYGNWLKVARPTGFGYGYWDLNNNGSLTASDSDLLLKVAVQTIACPIFKKCDINASGSVTTADASMLLKYAVGSLPPPGTATTTPATTITSKLISTAVVQDSGGRGVFKLRYEVTAMGGSVYIPEQASSTAQYFIEKQGIAQGNMGVAALESTLVDTTKIGNYVIKSGETATFYLTVALAPTSSGYYRTVMNGVRWGIADDYTAEKMQVVDFKTDYISLVPYTEF